MRRERFDRRWYPFAAEILPDASHYPRAVDLGCGRGEFSRMLQQRGFQVTCLDIDPDNVAACQALGFESRQADLNEPLPLGDSSYDLAIMLDVIEHVPRAQHLIKEIARVVRPTGLLLLSTPNYGWVLHRIRGLMGQPPPGEGYHFRFFVPANLTAILQSAGFKVVQRNSWTYPPPPINYLRRQLGKPRVDWHIPQPLERLWAYSLVWLAMRMEEDR